MDIADIPLVRALEKKGLEVVDGQHVMLEARIVKTKDEIELLKTAAAMVDAAYESIARAIRPGARENDLVAVANQVLYTLGSDLVECVNSVAGSRGRPHPHTFSDRIIRPGDMVFLDIMHSYMGYRTCYYRTFVCGKPTKPQLEAYELAWKWLKDSIDAVKPGATTADVAISPSVRPRCGNEHLGKAGDFKAIFIRASISHQRRDGLCPGDLLSFRRWERSGQDRGGGRGHKGWV
jgi:Xaa-Pro dipeptidase